jgi:hypothetical protein
MSIREDTVQLTIFRSAICAADILEAWRENDPEHLKQELANGATPDFEPCGNSHECERLELLDGIATQIRRSIASGNVQDAGVYIRLLRHLAKPASMLSNRDFIC